MDFDLSIVSLANSLLLERINCAILLPIASVLMIIIKTNQKSGCEEGPSICAILLTVASVLMITEGRERRDEAVGKWPCGQHSPS